MKIEASKRLRAQHQSELVMRELQRLGWSKAKVRRDGSQESIKEFQADPDGGGLLNPDNIVEVVASYDAEGRYLEVHLGFRLLFDVDTRDGDAKRIAQDVNKRVATAVRKI